MCDCDAELPVFMNDSTPTAKKEHKCCECRGVIKIGEKYNRYDGKWDEFATYKRCLDCVYLIKKIGDMEDGCTCIPFGGLIDEVFDGEVFMEDYILIRSKRKSEIKDWMIEKLNEFNAQINQERQMSGDK